MVDEKYSVDGYVFSTEEEYNEAVKEKRGVDYMKSKTNMNNVQSVQEVYEKVLEKDIFKTQVGYGFMREMQQILVKSKLVEDEQIKNIRVNNGKDKKLVEANKQLKTKLSNVEAAYKSKFFNSVILNVGLIILIIVIIMITTNSKNANVLNYKERLEAEYISKENDLAIWEQELENREKLLEEEK